MLVIPSILFYVPPSVKYLGHTTPPVFIPDPQHPRFLNQIDASGRLNVTAGKEMKKLSPASL